jgi:hypothetical protein
MFSMKPISQETSKSNSEAPTSKKKKINIMRNDYFNYLMTIRRLSRVNQPFVIALTL